MDTVDNPSKKTTKSAVLGVYAKQPLAGQVKTRLCPPLSHQQAAEFYACALQETVQRLQSAADFELVICYAGERAWFAENFPGVGLLPQQGQDLGARMADSLQRFLQQGYQQAVLIGSDSPDLPLPLIEQAFAALQQVEVVLAPAGDGGYVLIGESSHRPELFAAIPWSTGVVLAETRRRIEQLQINAVQLPAWEDLDDQQALVDFLQRSPHSQTAAYLRRHLPEQLFSNNSTAS